MTIQEAPVRITYTANGVATDYAFPFWIEFDFWMAVYIDDILQTTGYTIAGVGDANGGIVTFSTPPASGAVVVLYRAVPYTQEVSYYRYGEFPAESHEFALDKLTAEVQRLSELGERALTAGISMPGPQPGISYTLPPYDAGKALQWSTTTQAIVNSTINLSSLSGVHNDLTGRSDADVHPASSITGLQALLDTKEDDLGAPTTDDWVLASKADGTRFWTGSQGAPTFLSLGDTPGSYSGFEGFAVQVNVAGTGLEFKPPGSVTISWGDIQGTLSNQTDLQTEFDNRDIAIAAKVSPDDYATATVGGTLKARHDPTTHTLYLTNDGTNP